MSETTTEQRESHEQAPERIERVAYWYDGDVHGFVAPVSWALAIDGRPIDGYTILSPKGSNMDIYGRTDEIGVEILSEYSDSGEQVNYAVSDSHNLSSNHEETGLIDFLRNGMDADFSPVMKGKHHGRGKLKNLETARASPNPDFLRDRFDRAFAFRIHRGSGYAMKPDYA